MVFFRIQNTLALNQSKFYPFIFWVLTLHFLIVSQLNSVSFTWIYHLFYHSILLKLFCSLIFFTWTNSMLHHLHLSVIVSYLYLFHTFFLCFYCYDYTTTFPIKGQAVCYTLFPFPSLRTIFFFLVVNFSLTVGIFSMNIYISGYSSIKAQTHMPLASFIVPFFYTWFQWNLFHFPVLFHHILSWLH